MNIKITHSWLLEYLETDAKPDEIREYLSLCGPSIESVTKVNNDWVYDIEVISNRIDYASVFGIAQEAVAILPMFGKKAKLKYNPLEKYRFFKLNFENKEKLTVKIEDKNLCSRFTGVIFDNIKIQPSPKFISDRLIAAGIKSINNVVDISNYLMVSLGQPVHVFDYEKIAKATMKMRASKKGEKITTLDKKTVILPGGDIVIEDGSGKLIDLCGIMGGLNSSITEKTKKVLLFVQTYNKEKIRRTTMTTGVRTAAATYFEKGLDEERVEATTAYGAELLEKYASGRIVSNLYDIYPNPYKEKTIKINYEIFDKVIGVKINHQKINEILNHLGFKLIDKKVKIPSWRKYDINIPEDLVEEVARIYGYHNIPSQLQPSVYIEQPKEMEDLFIFQSRIKTFLKHLGLNEVINYSMISKKMIEDFELKIDDHLRLSNSISNEIEYLRISLLPSLYKNINQNSGKKEILRFFEIGKIYIKKSSPTRNNPCDEIYKLAIAVNTDYFDLKGIIEALFKELNIDENIYKKAINIKKKQGVFMFEIDLQWLIDNYKEFSKYQPINPYAVIKLDKTFVLSSEKTYADIKKKAFQSKLLKKIEVVSLFENKLTLRFYYSSEKRNIREEEAKEALALV